MQVEITVEELSAMRDITFASGPFQAIVEQCDIFFENPSTSSISQFSTLVDNGIIADLTDILLENGNVAGLLTEAAWKEGTLDGRIYAIPLSSTVEGYDKENEGVWESGFLVDRSVITALKVPMPTTPDELLEVCKLAKSKGLPCDLVVLPGQVPWLFHRSYDEWPFYVDRIGFYVIDT